VVNPNHGPLNKFPCFGNPAIPEGPVPARRSACSPWTGRLQDPQRAVASAYRHARMLYGVSARRRGFPRRPFCETTGPPPIRVDRRPTITRGLALSAIYVFNILDMRIKQLQCQNVNHYFKSLDLQKNLESNEDIKHGKETNFVSTFCQEEVKSS